jgi:hypothetical protein
MRDLGYTENQDFAVEWRFAEGETRASVELWLKN